MTNSAEIVDGWVMHSWARDLFPIARSITGPGFLESLEMLNNQLSGQIKVHSVPSGTQAFDWTVPDEWVVRDAWIEHESGERIVDFKENNLHLVGYSVPVDRWINLDDLQKHLYSLPDQPDAIPYVTSYYERRWGFCLSQRQREQLTSGQYRVLVDTDLKSGMLNYGELVIEGDSEQEVFLSTYLCHPSMANNELSGPVVTTGIAKWLQSLSKRRYTYRIAYVPETIGAIVYLSRNLKHLQKHVIAGFNVTCIGDDRCYSYLPSRAGDSLADRASKHALRHIDPHYISYTWLDRGSDERQYCSPGVDLPVATIMRSKYGEYSEYHTSADDLSLVTPSGLFGGYKALKSAIEAIEYNGWPKSMVLGEPQLGKRGLRPTLSCVDSYSRYDLLSMHLLSYSDGRHDLIEIADLIGVPIKDLHAAVQLLKDNNLIRMADI